MLIIWLFIQAFFIVLINFSFLTFILFDKLYHFYFEFC